MRTLFARLLSMGAWGPSQGSRNRFQGKALGARQLRKAQPSRLLTFFHWIEAFGDEALGQDTVICFHWGWQSWRHIACLQRF
jgi:hypothetical protein